MKVKRERINANGKREVTVELSESNASLLEVSTAGFYRLGNGVDHVVSGHALIDSERVTWCDISQAWED